MGSGVGSDVRGLLGELSELFEGRDGGAQVVVEREGDGSALGAVLLGGWECREVGAERVVHDGVEVLEVEDLVGSVVVVSVSRVVVDLEVVDEDDGAWVGVEDDVDFFSEREVLFPVRVEVEEEGFVLSAEAAGGGL